MFRRYRYDWLMNALDSFTLKMVWGVVVVLGTLLGIGSTIISIAAAFNPMVPQPWEVPTIFFRAAEIIIEAGEKYVDQE